MDEKNATVRNNEAKNRFELEIDGKLSISEYQRVDDQTLALVHTEVDPELEGKGIGSQLTKGVFEYVEQHNMKIVSLCPFVSTYLKRHPEWNRIVADKRKTEDVE
ncbi:GNAT family N-acetyltransferase [Spirosoma pomorum]